MRLVRNTLWAGVAMTLFVGVCLLAASLYTYRALTAETLIADLRFEPVGAQRYRAFLRTGDRCLEREYVLLGDQWRVDAEFVKWKYWASLLGVESYYRLDRIEGRYRSALEQNAKPQQAFELGPASTLDITALAAKLGRLNFLLDATYGSSTYQDMAPGLIFEIYKTPTGLITRTRLPDPPRMQDGALAVSVEQACGQRPGFWYGLVRWTDRTVGRLLQAA